MVQSSNGVNKSDCYEKNKELCQTRRPLLDDIAATNMKQDDLNKNISHSYEYNKEINKLTISDTLKKKTQNIQYDAEVVENPDETSTSQSGYTLKVKKKNFFLIVLLINKFFI